MNTANLTRSERDAVIEQVKQEIIVANMQEMLTKMSKKCFKKCIDKPGASLDGSEQKCLAMCMDRYMDTVAVVATSYKNRLQKEHDQM